MTLKEPVTVAWIADYIGAEVKGNKEFEVTGINEIHKVREGDVTFVDIEKYYDRSLNSAASVVIINKDVPVPEGKTLLVMDDPFTGYVKLVKRFHHFQPQSKMISDSAEIGEGTILQPNVFIGPDVKIGKNCIIHPNVVIYESTIIGDNVIIHSGCIIAADGFYFKKRADKELYYDKLESCGRVVIGNDVEIGACCTIDRGASGDTVLGDGTKFDNHIHIGHGAVIGKNCLFAAQVGVGGKAILEDNVTLWGQVGVSKDLTIEANTIVMAQSGVPSSLKGGKVYFGYPVEEAREKRRELAWIKRIPEIWEKVKNL